MAKSNLGKYRIYFIPYFLVTAHRGQSGQDIKAETWRQTCLEFHTVLPLTREAHSQPMKPERHAAIWFAQTHSRTTYLGNSITYSVLGSPIPRNNPSNPPTDMITGQNDVENLSTETPFTGGSGCVGLTITLTTGTPSGRERLDSYCMHKMFLGGSNVTVACHINSNWTGGKAESDCTHLHA